MKYLFRRHVPIIVLLVNPLVFIVIFVNMMIKVAYLVESEGAFGYWTIKWLFICVYSQVSKKFAFASKSLEALLHANLFYLSIFWSLNNFRAAALVYFESFEFMVFFKLIDNQFFCIWDLIH